MKRRLAAAFAVVSVCVATPSYAHYISGYAVGNHSRCGANNLPGTIAELQKFFGSSNFPDDAAKNVLWTDARVKTSDWGMAHDKFDNADAASGTDGVDSALISYIASHGGTSRAVYTALPGGADGCSIKTTNMAIGDANARYLILSTCQGLKIGTGDNPTRPGENPQITWRDANKGLNCILGYSNNMDDADEYGAYLLDNLATSDDTLVDAFFKASRRISYSNVPAALCFGTDDNNARQHLTTAKQFTEEPYGTGGSAYRYDMPKRLDDTFVLPAATGDKAIARVIKIAHLGMKIQSFVKSFLGQGVVNLSASPNSSLSIYRSPQGTLTYDNNTAVMNWQRHGALSLQAAPRAMAMKDETVIRIARDFLKSHSAIPAKELQATYLIDHGVSDTGLPVVFAKTVVFHQRLGDLTPLAAAGSVEVTVNTGGEVVAMTSSLIQSTALRLVEWVDSNSIDLTAAKKLALQHLQRRFPDANLTITGSRVGYDVGDYATLQERGRLTLEVAIEAEAGGFTRRYAEKIPL